MQTGKTKLTLSQRLRLPEPSPAWLLRTAFFFVLAYIAIWILSLTAVASARGEIDGRITAGGYLLATGLHGVVVIGAVVQWARRRLGGKWLAGLRLSNGRGAQSGQIVITLLIGLGAAWALDLMGGLVGAKDWLDIPAQFNGLLEPVSLTWALGAMSVVLLQPIAETLIFSGLLYPATARRSGENVMAIVGVGIVYMLVSIFLSVQQGSNWFNIVLPLLTMLFVVGVRAYTQSTRSAIMARIGFGLFVLLVAIIRPGA
jgi:hypothetical protein